MILKPTIINGQWVYAPAPPQDLPWIERALSAVGANPIQLAKAEKKVAAK